MYTIHMHYTQNGWGGHVKNPDGLCVVGIAPINSFCEAYIALQWKRFEIERRELVEGMNAREAL